VSHDRQIPGPIASTLLRLLLRAFPTPFRYRYGEQMSLFLAEERREQRYQGRFGGFRFWPAAVFDLARVALRLRRQQRTNLPYHATPTPTPRRLAMDHLAQDLRNAYRALRRRPGWTLAAAATLGIGIGASSAIFSLVRGVLLAPLPYPDSGRLVTLQAYIPDSGRTRGSVSFPVFEAIRDAEDVTTGLGCYSVRSLTVNLGGGAERMRGAVASSVTFRALGVSPVAGRLFQAEDDLEEAPPTVVLSHGLWQERFGGDAGVVGRILHIREQATEVIGVMPQDFVFPDQGIRFWRSMSNSPRRATSHYLSMIGRLVPGVDTETAIARLGGILLEVPTGARGRTGNISIRTQLFLETLVGEVRPQLLLFMLAVAGVLAIGCINVVNLMLGRAAEREHELSLRAALGAGRFRLIRQMLTETLLLGLFGGGLGLAVALAVEWGLLGLASDQLPRGGSPGIDLRAFAFALALSVLVGAVVGLIPALRASRPDVRCTLANGGRATIGGRQRHRQRGVMAVAQIALAAMLLTNAGLLAISLHRLSAVETGMDTEGVLTFRPALGSAYDSAEKRHAFFRAMEERLHALPGSIDVGFTATAPFGGGHNGDRMVVEGTAEPASREDELVADIQIVSHRFFDIVGLHAVAGRLIDARDEVGPGRVAVVNASLARTYFGDPQTALGRRIDIGEDDRRHSLEIVGVVPDIRPYSLVRPVAPMVFEAFGAASEEWGYASLIARTSNESSAALAAAIPDLVRALDPTVPVTGLSSLDERLGRQLALPRLRMRVLTVFAGSALLLALIGVYGVMSFLALERTREIGVRIALGARREQILHWFASHGVLITGIGLALGALGARASARMLEGYLFELETFDLRTFGVAALILAVAALVAVYLPSRRASRLDPVEALRTE
jgi:predicted permease